MKARERLWCLTIGGFLAGTVCMVVPVGWTTLHSATSLRVFAYLEFAVGAFGLAMLFVTRRRSPR